MPAGLILSRRLLAMTHLTPNFHDASEDLKWDRSSSSCSHWFPAPGPGDRSATASQRGGPARLVDRLVPSDAALRGSGAHGHAVRRRQERPVRQVWPAPGSDADAIAGGDFDRAIDAYRHEPSYAPLTRLARVDDRGVAPRAVSPRNIAPGGTAMLVEMRAYPDSNHQPIRAIGERTYANHRTVFPHKGSCRLHD